MLVVVVISESMIGVEVQSSDDASLHVYSTVREYLGLSPSANAMLLIDSQEGKKESLQNSSHSCRMNGCRRKN